MNFKLTYGARPGTHSRIIFVSFLCMFLLAKSKASPALAFVACVLPPGQVTTDFFGGGFNDTGFGSVLQPDGKIVLIGQAQNSAGSYFGLARYNTNGSLDPSFGIGGKVASAVSNADTGRAIALQSDGKIVVAGQTDVGSSFDFRVSRFNSNGAPDASFGNQGSAVVDFGNSFDNPSAVVVQKDGKIVAAGYTQSGSNSNIAVLRCNTNGSLDATFGAGGKVVTTLDKVDSVHSMVIQSDGKIVVAGALSNPSTQDDFLLVRFNTDGSLDNSFGTNGVTSTDFFSGEDVAIGLALQPDGRLVVVGLSKDSTGATSSWAVGRYQADGFLDPTFGSGTGRVVTFVGNEIEDTATAVGLQANGQIVVAGYCLNGAPTGQDFVVGRYNTDGSRDTSFGSAGEVKTDFCEGQDTASGVLVQPDGKIVATGTALVSADGFDFALVRYNAAGSLDPAFNGIPEPAFNYCMRDSVSGNYLQFDSTTGAYLFTRCRDGFTLAGTGKVQLVGSIIMLTDKESTCLVSAGFNTGQHTGSATITLILAPGISQTIRINATNPNAGCSCSG